MAEIRDQLLLEIGLSIKQLQDDTRATQQIILDNIDFFKGMGDVSDTLANILVEAMDKYDIANQIALDQFTKSSEFFKHTLSQKYANQSIMQEWFSDTVVTVMSAMCEYNTGYIQQWLDLKFKDFTQQTGVVTATLTYEQRVEFGEGIFKFALEELKVDPMALYVMRTLYIPYVSIYFLRPFDDYPYYDEWITELKRAHEAVKLKREKEKLLNDIETTDNS